MRVLLFASFFNLFFCSNFKVSIFSILRFKIFCKCWRWASCHAAIFLNRNVIHESWWNIPSSVLWMLCYGLYLKLTSNFLPSSIKLFPENKNLTFSGALSLTFCVRLSNFIKIVWQPCLTVQQIEKNIMFLNDPNPKIYLPCFLQTTQTGIFPPLQHFEQARWRHCVA